LCAAMEALQAELKACKEQFGKELELSKAEKGAPGFPFPVSVTRYTPQPESASCWDCDELPVRLEIQSADPAEKKVAVEVPPIFPGELSGEIEKAIEKEWKKLLGKAKPGGSVWMLAKIFEWVEAKFGDLLRLVPTYVDSYVGCDAMGASMRRYTLVGPAAEGDEDDEEEEQDEEEQQRRVDEYIAREQARIEAEFDAKLSSDVERRDMAAKGVFEEGEKIRILSKKEQAEANLSRKEKSGTRWRKTGSKSNKPMRDEEKEKALKGLPGQKKK